MKIKKLYKKETFKDESQWLKARGLGGTSASVILGHSPFMGIMELYRAIVMPNETRKDNGNESMRYGKRLEPIMRRVYAIDFKDKYKVHTPRNFEMFRRIDYPYITATVDGILTEINGEKREGIWECKTHDIRNKQDEQNWNGRLPQNYYDQVIHYLLVRNTAQFVEVTAKLNFYDFFNKDGKKLIKSETRYYHIERKDVEKDIEYLLKVEKDFWENNVLKKKMPSVKISF